MDHKLELLQLYNNLMDKLGPSNWWTGDSPFEVAVGAILTQNTNWGNVEKAIANLQRHELLQPENLIALNREKIAELIRPAGYFRVKAERLGNFLSFLHLKFDLNMGKMAKRETSNLRKELLDIKGIGPETADSILLYALQHPVFVIDAYTKRIFHRHGILDQDKGYSEFQGFVMERLPLDRQLYNEYHALIVRAGKKWCKKSKPNCAHCPLRDL